MDSIVNGFTKDFWEADQASSVCLKKTHSVISLFSGCGGLDLGFVGGFSYLGREYSRNPFSIILANDINERAVLTQRHNFPEINALCCDVAELVKSELPKADVLLGGFPCQDFSLAGKQQGLTVARGNLYKAMVLALKKVQPQIFIAENVKGLLLWESGQALATMVADFEECGYRVDYKLFNMADHGVPQKRERIFIVGVRSDLKKDFIFPPQTHFENPIGDQLAWLTIENAIGDLECQQKHNSLPNSDYSKAKKNKGQGNTTTKKNQPAPTMRAEHHGNIEFHYMLPRRLSAREAARIQSFPDNFVFLKSTSDAYRQIGNAVPPVFAWHMAQAVVSFLQGE